MQGPKTPDYLLSTSEINFVAYPDKRLIGIQFVNPSGKHTFVSIHGGMLPLLAKQCADLLSEIPEAKTWKPTHHQAAH